jgi:hypothetical protein
VPVVVHDVETEDARGRHETWPDPGSQTAEADRADVGAAARLRNRGRHRQPATRSRLVRRSKCHGRRRLLLAHGRRSDIPAFRAWLALARSGEIPADQRRWRSLGMFDREGPWCGYPPRASASSSPRVLVPVLAKIDLK